MSRSNLQRRGFTLIELLVSIAILGMVFGSSFYAISTFLRTEGGINKKLGQIQSVKFVMARIIKEVKGAKGINAASSDSKLILNYEGFSISYDYANGKVRRRKGGGSSYLTEEGKISGLKFDYPKAKLVEILINTDNQDFESKAFVRN